MYFVQCNPLKLKLRSRSLSDEEALPYLILEGVVLTLLLDTATDGLMNGMTWHQCVLKAVEVIVHFMFCDVPNHFLVVIFSVAYLAFVRVGVEAFVPLQTSSPSCTTRIRAIKAFVLHFSLSKLVAPNLKRCPRLKR